MTFKTDGEKQNETIKKTYQKTKTLQPKPTKKTPTCVVVQIKCIEH